MLIFILESLFALIFFFSCSISIPMTRILHLITVTHASIITIRGIAKSKSVLEIEALLTKLSRALENASLSFNES